MAGHKPANSDAVVERYADLHYIANVHPASLHYQSAPHENLPEIGDFVLPEDLGYPSFGDFCQEFSEPRDCESANEPELPSLVDSLDISIAEVEEDPQRVTLRQRINDRRFLLAGLFCSLLLHYSLGGALLNLERDIHLVDLPTTVTISLLPTNPLRKKDVVEIVEKAFEDEPPEEEFAEVETESTAPTPVEPESLVEPQERLLLTEELIPEFEEPASVPTPIVVPPIIVGPSTVEVVQSIKLIENENASRLWAHDCNARQEESDFFICNKQASPNYDIVRENSTYRSLNPTWRASRSLRTLPTIAESAGDLAASLREAEIPESLSEYLMEEVEAGITHNSDLGDLTIFNIEIMTDKSDSEKFFREQLTAPWRDPWLLTRSKERQQRNVHEQ